MLRACLSPLALSFTLAGLVGCAGVNEGNIHSHGGPVTDAWPGHGVAKKVRDRDADGVPDRKDSCPTLSGPAELDGCPTKRLARITDGKIEISDAVYFATGSDTIEERSFELLDNVATIIKDHDEIKGVVVEGHTDNQGDPAFNKDLSQKRAAAVVAFLVSKGVDAAKLSALGYGVEKPVASNDDDAGRAKNRRVEFTVDAAPEEG